MGLLATIFGKRRTPHNGVLPRFDLDIPMPADIAPPGSGKLVPMNWMLAGDRLDVDERHSSSDLKAAEDPVRRVQQRKIHEYAAQLVESARLYGDGGLGKTAVAFRDAVDGSPRETRDRLGVLYRLYMRLGDFMEKDDRVRAGCTVADVPLPATARRLLDVLVRHTAFWLQGFPSVAAWRNAVEELGRKAIVADAALAQNASSLPPEALGSDPLVQKMRLFFRFNGEEIKHLTEPWPEYLRAAVLELFEEAWKSDPSVPSKTGGVASTESPTMSDPLSAGG